MTKRSAAKLAVIYAREVSRCVARHSVFPADVVGSFPQWWESTRDPDRTPLADRQPWMSFAAIRYLAEHLKQGQRVFEYGVGGTTAFFLDRGARLVSVDHDASWTAKVREVCDGHWVVHTVQPEEEPDPEYSSHIVPGSFRPYVEVIDRYADFDIVVVDGRARAACLRHAQQHVTHGGLLVLDNSERAIYSNAAVEIDALGWRRQDFFGPGPYNLFFWQTTIWIAGRR